ncbi:MAG: histidine-type phosphatase [Desulfovibrionaceae bacterium]|nr:histidine-type phosphatase [Desulfovibrionaceae bacterium]
MLMRRVLTVCCLFWSVCLCFPAFAASAEGDARLVRVVALARHGVRAPTQDAATLALWSSRTWPVWPVKRAHLTPRGAELVSRMWAHLGRLWGVPGVWGVEGAQPAPGAVFVRADTDQRTRGTARALLQGLGCSQGYAVSTRQRDTLFHPVKGGQYRFDAAQVSAAIAGNGALTALRAELTGPLKLMESIAGPLGPELCRQYGRAPGCGLADLPDTVSLSEQGHSVGLQGGLAIASDMAEIFLLEYGQWPDRNAGWGQVDARVLQELLPLHSRVFDLVNRAGPVAWARGSALLAEMAAALAGNHHDPRCNAAVLTVFVGHDTNIASVGGLLGLQWQSEGFAPNEVPPGSVLLLEVWQKRRQREIRPRFFSLPLDMLHAADLPAAALSALEPVAAGKSLGLEAFGRQVRRLIAGAPLAPQERPAVR